MIPKTIQSEGSEAALHATGLQQEAKHDMIVTFSLGRARALQERWTKMVARCSLIHRTDWGAGIPILLALAYALWRLDLTPPLFWDEGWTLMVARNWVERGFYGGLLAGQPTSPGLSAAFPVVAPLALSFRLLGIGVWQARVAIVLYTLGALVLLYHLSRRLYNRRVATAALAVALFMGPFADVHPLIVGRVVLAETPMLFFLLAGYCALLASMERSVWFLPLAVLCWGFGLGVKAQPLPFWALSLGLPLLLMLYKREWKVAGQLGMGMIGSLATSQVLVWLWRLLVGRDMLRGGAVPGLIRATAWVPVTRVRLAALALVLILGGPTLLALGYAAWQTLKKLREGSLSEADVMRSSLLILASCWFAWYVLLSVGWPRYLFPPMFLGSMFVAAMLHDWTDGFRLSSIIRRSGQALRHRRFNRQGLGALLAVVIVSFMVPLTLQMLGSFSATEPDTSVQQAAAFLNARAGPEDLIEGYSPELFFFLDRDYHYPPDEVNVQVIHRAIWGDETPIAYDPLSSDPDYLVVCRKYGVWTVYEAVLDTGAFRLLEAFGPYEVYERVR